MNSVL
jgi:hypothetical protein